MFSSHSQRESKYDDRSKSSSASDVLCVVAIGKCCPADMINCEHNSSKTSLACRQVKFPMVYLLMSTQHIGLVSAGLYCVHVCISACVVMCRRSGGFFGTHYD